MTGILRKVRLGRWFIAQEARADGVRVIRATEPLGPYPSFIADRLRHWAAAAPDRIFLGELRDGALSRTITYSQALAQVCRLAQSLLDRQLGQDAPIAVLSENDIEQGLLCLAAQYVGVLYAPISPAYSLMSRDFARLRQVLSLVRPRMVYASDVVRYAGALAVVREFGAEVVCQRGAQAMVDSFHSLLASAPRDDVEARREALRPEDAAKLLFTSGSTGFPKGVINTHRMQCANQQMLRRALPFVEEEPPVLVDWLPWHHTFGGNHNFNLVLDNGGTLYIDDGRPTPEGIERTVANLRAVAPTLYFNVPRGFEQLLPYLFRDANFARAFFSRANVLFYAGASLSVPVWNAYRDLAVATVGRRVAMVTSLGSTETAPLSVIGVHDAEGPGEIGLPAPGVEAKLVPCAGKLELRLRGPHITPGYWRQPELTASAFDEEGFYKIGDAVRFLDESEPERGFLFDGRLAEDFKLSTGSWVNVAAMRARILRAFAPLARDVVVTAPDRDEVGALLLPDPDAWRLLSPRAATLSDALAGAPLRRWLAENLDAIAAEAVGSSERLTRIMVVVDPLSLDAGEITDKGSINQRKVIELRAKWVDALYAGAAEHGVVAWSGLSR